MSSSNSNKNKKTLLDFSNLTKQQKKQFENMVNNKSDSFDNIDFDILGSLTKPPNIKS